MWVEPYNPLYVWGSCFHQIRTPLIQGGVSVQQGLSAAFESAAHDWHRSAADKRYSLCGRPMNELCFLSNLTSSEWASWVQAIGSIIAIIAAAWIAVHQAKLQHKSALELHRTARRTARAEVAGTLSALAENSAKAMAHVGGQLRDREAVHQAAEGLIRCDIGEVRCLDSYLGAIPLHELPDSLVTLTMVLGSTVRQFREKIEMALRLHRQMDAAMFEDFFRTLTQMNESVRAICKDISEKVQAHGK